jgi:hypothetical protein
MRSHAKKLMPLEMREDEEEIGRGGNQRSKRDINNPRGEVNGISDLRNIQEEMNSNEVDAKALDMSELRDSELVSRNRKDGRDSDTSTLLENNTNRIAPSVGIVKEEVPFRRTIQTIQKANSYPPTFPLIHNAQRKNPQTTSITRRFPPPPLILSHPEPHSPLTTLLSSRNHKKYTPTFTYTLRNSLLPIVGLLELANASDFAANIWNTIPVPKFVAVLVGIGGSFALFISGFAFYDAWLSTQNYRALRKEKEVLESVKDGGSEIKVEVLLDVNHRELGTEMIDRIGLDLFMGFGGVMVGIGTLLAIWGANPRVFRASNLLSGYIGNAPVAFFGFINATWSFNLFRRAHRHRASSHPFLKTEPEVWKLVDERTKKVQLHSGIVGTIGIIAGGASLVTAEHWEGYPILIPCIILSVYCNYIFRTGIGYDRSLLRSIPSLSLDLIISELKYIHSLIQILETKSENIMDIFPTPESIEEILEFLIHYDLFEDFCGRLLGDRMLATAVLGPLDREVVVSEDMLLHKPDLYVRLRELAEETVRRAGRRKMRYRQRWLIEILGAWCTFDRQGIGQEKV